MNKILIIGDAGVPTGFARVIRSIFEPLKGDFELHQLATRYDGRPHDYPWKLYRADAGKSVYGYDQICFSDPELQSYSPPSLRHSLPDSLHEGAAQSGAAA